MSEEPEQVLVQENVSAFRGIEKVRAHQSVQQQQAAGYHHCRHRKYDCDGDHQLLPEQDGHAIERHSGSAVSQDGRCQANGHTEGRDLSKGDHLRPDIGAVSGGIRRSRKWHIGEPANIGAGIREKTTPKDESTSDVEVVAEGIQAGKSDIASSAHQWNDVHTKSLKHHGHGK